MIVVRDLRLSRGERVLLRSFNLSVGRGEAVALTGANGAGKTSLLRAIAGFIRPDAGRIDFVGLERDSVSSLQLHWLGHQDGLKSSRRVREEAAFQAAWAGADAKGLETALTRLALEPLLDMDLRRLSAGQRRRVAFARLIAAPRPLWLLDEPFGPLDRHWRAAIGEMMQDHLSSGGSIVAAVHDPLPVPVRSVEIGGAS